MSCGCTTITITPTCSPVPSLCCQPELSVQTYTFENANVSGVGVFDNETSFLVQFRGIVSASDGLTVTLDDPNNTIILTLDMTQLVADIPDATTAQRGVLETATDGEAQAKAATDKILTPSNLAALTSSQTFQGLVELATNAETITGTSDTLAVRPAGLAAFAATQKTTTTFADAVARAAAVPLFIGQFGAQLDTDTPYIAFAAPAGSWNQILASGANTFSVTQAFPVTWTIDDGWTLDGTGNGTITFDQFLSILFTATNSLVEFAGTTQFEADVNFHSTARIQDTGVNVPANSVLTTSGTAGQLNSSLINTFVSSANTQTGYTTFANPATLRTCDTATVTLPQLAQIVGTLIEDLKAIKLPAT